MLIIEPKKTEKTVDKAACKFLSSISRSTTCDGVVTSCLRSTSHFGVKIHVLKP